MLRRILASLILLGLVTPYFFSTRTSAAPAASNKSQKHNPKLAPELDSAATNDAVRVIIQTKGRPSAAHDDAIRAKGGVKGHAFDSFDALTAVVPQSAVADLAARDDVAYITPDRKVSGQLAITRETTGAALAQSGFQGTPGVTGKGVGIAIIDSGISAAHPDFQQKNGKSRIVTALDFTNGGKPYAGQDRDGHGTGVASVAAGNGKGSQGYGASYVGIAPDANLLDLKVLDGSGSGKMSDVMDAVNWAIVNQKRFNIRVINLSLGTPVRESFRNDPLCLAVEKAVRSGIVVVAAAGNNGHTDEIIGHKPNGDPIYRPVFGAIDSPGNSPYAITVGASDSVGTARRSDDVMAQFSSKGPTLVDHIVKPDLVAPGRAVVAAMSQENPNSAVVRPDRVAVPTTPNTPQNLYYTYYGTYFSTPVVSGIVALMLEANKSLTPTLVKASLMRTANPLAASLFASRAANILTQGAGLVNAAAAVELANAFAPNADKLGAGQKLFQGNTKLSSLNHTLSIGGESVAASTRVLYADGVLFREKPVLSNGIILSDGILLADGIILSDGMVIGDGIILSDGILMSGDSAVHGERYVLNTGILMSGDGILMSGDGILMSGDGILMSGDGILMSGDGILMSGDGLVLGDGRVLSDTLRLGADGILMSGDGIVLSDSRTLADGIILSDGIIMTEGILMSGDGILMSGDGMVVGDGIIMTEGILMSGDGILMSGDGILMSGDGILMSGDGILMSGDAL